MEQQTLNFDAVIKPASKAETEKTPRIFTVGEIIGAVRGLLEGNFANLWVVGEVSNLRTSPSGHTYFSLKDSKALLKSALFKGFASKLKFQIKDGMELVCHGNLSLYEKGGDFNLIVDHCEPKGVGALQLAFEQLKDKLAKEGLFAAERKKPLPFLPRKIGIVTSPTGAAIRDILNILGRRFPDIDVLLYPVRVQGDGAAAEIAQAINWMNAQTGIDVMIVGRGGGSLEDLWAFNEEIVARAIFASKIPVISAVGHEIDFTISDFVADKRAPTPSAAAEIAVPKKEDLKKLTADRFQRLMRGVLVCLEMKLKTFSQTKSHLKPPTARFPDLTMQIDGLRTRLQNGLKNLVDRSDSKLRRLAAELSHLSPLAVLAKGYSVVYKGDKVVNSSKSLNKNDEIKIRMSEGKIAAKVI
ncbi:MAG: exodeoxyribonuclease VII large subunit [Deltaproteobacteria bacterium]|nr:exodeoxyribonuclease VII large subunit [Deltaproteobacteria bacterium]